jgi:hypothetical protein
VAATGNKLNNPGSRVDRPDLDWSQVKETIAMLCLAMAQIDTTLTESTRSVGELTESFTHMAKESMKINELCEKNETAESWPTSRLEILQLSQDILKHMNLAVVAFQFYDRLSQKLGHVNGSLSHLGDLIGDNGRLYNPQEWRKIQDEIRSNYTMECERLMFDMIMKGSTVEEALALYRHEFSQADTLARDATDDDIELF